jgi:hypothetical protein
MRCVPCGEPRELTHFREICARPRADLEDLHAFLAGASRKRMVSVGSKETTDSHVDAARAMAGRQLQNHGLRSPESRGGDHVENAQ